jgi:hypothetical protein
MKRFVTALLAAAAAAGGFDDPTSDLRGGPAALRMSASRIFIGPAETFVVSATIVDGQGNPVPGRVSFSSVDASVATVADLLEDTLPGLLSSSGEITGVAAGATYVRATGEGVTDSAWVVVVPAQFLGGVNPTTGSVGDVITLTAPAALSFDPATAAVFVNGAQSFVTSATSSQLQFVSPPSSGGTVSIDGLVLINQIALPRLDASTAIDIADPSEPGNDGPGGGQTIPLPTTVGASVTVYGAIEDGVDVDDFFTITTTTGDSLEIVIDWPVLDPNIDIDAYLLDATGSGFCVLDGCSAATGSDPEVISVRLAPSTTYELYMNLFDAAGQPTPSPYRITITRVD